MKAFWQEAAFTPGWALGDIPDIQRGKIPHDLLPRNQADCLALALLKREWTPLTPELVADGAKRLQERFPYNQLCNVLAIMARPYIVRERAASPEMHVAQIIRLRKFLQQILGSADTGSVISGETIYALISKRKLELVQHWPFAAPDDSAKLAVPAGAVIQWGPTMLMVAMMEQAYYFVELVSPQNLPDRAVDFVVGKTPQPDWFLAAQASLATVQGDLESMEFYRGVAKLPVYAKQSSRITGDNPDDRSMKFALGEALVEADASGTRRWEGAEKPWPYLNTVATRKSGKSQIEDDAETVAAREAGFDLVDNLDGRPTEEPEPPITLAANTIPEVEDLPPGLLADLAEVRDPEAVLRVCEARRKGVQWDEISESDRMKWRRAELALRKAIAREAIWRALPDASLSAASTSVYQERFPRMGGVYQTWAHLFDTPEKLAALKAVLAGERLPVTGRPPDCEN